ncbi:L-serine ammonia-lyase, iron-sulfur-dependent, subunit alpha, partial [Microbacterium arabinogalactanolyticum]|uniref:L-serine ammonia-lyase, iron-sulfur-dependent, subunit alpha n=1 Tax=Microbacterium arabinogalactanolyticum TaxID=69365 RepID=UPI0031E1AAB5
MLQSPCEDILYSRAKVYAGDQWASATIVGGHTRFVCIERQGETLYTLKAQPQGAEPACPLQVLAQTSLREIVDFIEQAPFADIRFILDAARLNGALSQEGLRSQWGLHVGTTLQKQRARGLMASDLASDIVIRTSAASDARMGGATLPAMSNSGSGNQ